MLKGFIKWWRDGRYFRILMAYLFVVTVLFLWWLWPKYNAIMDWYFK